MQQTGKVSGPVVFFQAPAWGFLNKKIESTNNKEITISGQPTGQLSQRYDRPNSTLTRDYWSPGIFSWESNCYKCKSIVVIFIVVDLADSLTLICSKYLFLTKSLEKIFQGLYLLEISNFYISSEKKSQGSKNVENFLANKWGGKQSATTWISHLSILPIPEPRKKKTTDFPIANIWTPILKESNWFVIKTHQWSSVIPIGL